MHIPARSYVVASTPRSGSSLLCEGLESTGIAGRPAEVFAPDFRQPWFNLWGLPSDAPFSDYLAAARRHGIGRNGVYGVKIQYMHVAVLADCLSEKGDRVLERLFPDAFFVNLVRRDRRAQALSWFRAIRTNQWFQTGNDLTPPAPELDPQAVLELQAHLDWQQSGWEAFFEREGVSPLTVEYEALADNYKGEIARVLAFLGLDPHGADFIPPPSLRLQADEVTGQWRTAMNATVALASATL
jgi:trehalose 2-sulfotransferase